MINLKNVNKYFGKLHVLKDINLNVKEGEKLVIIGSQWIREKYSYKVY